jgi:hypothetical protein
MTKRIPLDDGNERLAAWLKRRPLMMSGLATTAVAAVANPTSIQMTIGLRYRAGRGMKTFG